MTILEGVRVNSVSALARWRSQRSGSATFARLADSSPERRSERRRDARLKWGKTLDVADRFLCECLIADRTSGGARLKLTRSLSLPARFYLYEDDGGAVFSAAVVWRRGREIGCRLSLAPLAKRDIVRRMRSRYYAL